MQQTRPPTNTLAHKRRSTLSLPSFSFFVHVSLFVSTLVDICLFFSSIISISIHSSFALVSLLLVFLVLMPSYTLYQTDAHTNTEAHLF